MSEENESVDKTGEPDKPAEAGTVSQPPAEADPKKEPEPETPQGGQAPG